VIVVSDSEEPINPTAEAVELEYGQSNLLDVALVVLRQSEARTLAGLLDTASRHGVDLLMSVEKQGSSLPKSGNKSNIGIRYLYVSGRPLINVELLD
jgi:mannosidase alpha-like ER degradation enhancer 1